MEEKKEKTNANFVKLLSSYTVKDVMVPQKLIEIDADKTSLLHGFEELLTHNILSAPVYHKNSDGQKQYLGFLDVSDLVSCVVYAHTHGKKSTSWAEVVGEGAKAKFKDAKDGVNIQYLAKRFPWNPVKETTSLFDVAKLLGGGLHRVPVVDKDGHCFAIVSQSSLIQVFHKNKDKITPDSEQTLEFLKIGIKKVVSINEETIALKAMQTLDEEKVSGLAIVDEDGMLIGQTSANDLKLFVLDRGQLTMDLPILDYLSEIRQREASKKEKPGVVKVHTDVSLGRVIGLIAATKLHRVYLADKEGKPIGIISISDILHFVTDKLA